MTCLIFDCDGVLIDSEYLYALSETKLLKKLFGIDRTPKEHNKLYCGLGEAAFFKALEKELGGSLPPNFQQDLERYHKDVFETELRPIAHAKELLERLDLPRCVASNTNLDFLEHNLKITGLYDFLAPHIYSAETVGKAKPEPDLFLHAAAKLNAKPEECIVIEDGSHGIAAARAAGMRVFGFTGGSHCYEGYAEERLGQAELVFEDLRALPDLI